MKDFVSTGWWGPTLTTTDDPELKVIETDNGHTWTMRFYVGHHLIDCINMEYLTRLKKVDNSVKTLPVYNEEGVYLGSVIQRLEDAYEVDYPLPQDTYDGGFIDEP